MNLRFRSLASASLLLGAAFDASLALAQEPPPAEPAVPEAAAEPAPAPVAEAAQPASAESPADVVAPGAVDVLTPPVPAPVPAPPPAPPPEPAPEAAAEEPPPLKLGAWLRTDLRLSDTSGGSLNDVSSAGQFELHASGNVYKYVSATLNLVAVYSPEIDGPVAVEDGVVQVEPSPYFNVWVGRHLVAVDRSNFAGPYFMAPWFYPGFGFVDGQVAAPREGPFGRNDGVTVWGQIEGGLFKYFLGAYDLYDEDTSPLFSGRVSISLLNPEPGFWGTSTYHGMDLLSVGVGAQYKNDGSTTVAGGTTLVDDYSEWNVDLLFEQDFGAGGVLDIEGAYYKFNGDYEGTDAAWFGLLSYILPGEIGGGHLQPLVRVQHAMSNAPEGVDSWLVDGQINYVLQPYAARFSLGYRYGKAEDDELNMIFLGLQAQK